MVNDPNQTRAELRTRSRWNVGIWLVDFVMCWLALCGFVNVVIGVASFTLDVHSQDFNPSRTPVERFQGIGYYVAIAALGFAYMLWRNQWRFRLTTVFYLAGLWCVIYVVLWLLHFDNILLTAVAVPFVTLPLLYYCICWANQRQRLSELPDADRSQGA